MVDENPDYITVTPAILKQHAIVAVMKYHKGDYIQTRVSKQMPIVAARALAHSWAEALKLEIR